MGVGVGVMVGVAVGGTVAVGLSVAIGVAVVPAGGGEATSLAVGEDPVWGPNSRTVICARRVGNGVRVLSLLDVPTRQTKDLPRLAGSCSQPTWAR